MDYKTLKGYLKTRITALANLNNTVHVYDLHASDDAPAPYVVFKMPFAPNDMVSSKRTLDIHFWDYTGNDEDILTIAQDVRDGNGSTVLGLRNSTQTETTGFYKCEMELDTINIEEDDKNISHLVQSYIITVWES